MTNQAINPNGELLPETRVGGVAPVIPETTTHKDEAESHKKFKKQESFLHRLACDFVIWLGRFLVSLRYDVTVKGGEQLRDLKGPVLVLPNHTTYLDPLIVLSELDRFIDFRPLVFEGSYRNPIVYPVMRLIGAVEMPNLARANRKVMERAWGVLDELKHDLQKGDFLLLYPSGRLQSRGAEMLGVTRAAAELLTACPKTKVVMVRTSGLWGSSFGFAPTGTLPSLTGSILWGAAILLSNLLFFAPRRKVVLEVEITDPRTFPGLSREVLNPHLEKWFNANNHGTDEAPVYVPYHFLFGNRTYVFPPPEKTSLIFQGEVNPSIQTSVNSLLEEYLHRSLSQSEKATDYLLESLGMDSLDRMEFAFMVEQKFKGTRPLDLVPTRVGELWALAQGLNVSLQRDDSEVAVTEDSLHGKDEHTERVVAD